MPEQVQPGTVSDGHGIVIAVTTVADYRNPTPAELAAGVRITYGLTPDGFALSRTFARVTSGRYTLKTALSYQGVETPALTLRYVYDNETPNPVQTALEPAGKDLYLYHALGYTNDHVFAATDKITEVVPITTVQSTAVPPTANSELAKQQIPDIRGEVASDVVVAAAVV